MQRTKQICIRSLIPKLSLRDYLLVAYMQYGQYIRKKTRYYCAAVKITTPIAASEVVNDANDVLVTVFRLEYNSSVLLLKGDQRGGTPERL